MPEPTTSNQAKNYLAGGRANVDDVLEWREELYKDAPALGRALSRRLADGFIGGDELTAGQVDKIWKACKADEAFSHARRVLKRRCEPDASTKITQPPADPAVAATEDELRQQELRTQALREQWALMTSKDPDLMASVRHDWALKILKPNLATSRAETLGIAGGIYKRRWESDGRAISLEQSLVHYLAPVDRGRAPATAVEDHDRDGRGVTAENGYPAINAAFVCDLLAAQTGDPTNQADYRARADALRARITKAITSSDYWSSVTLAEAWFGLGDIIKAEALFAEALTWAQKPDPWQRRTTADQIARLGSLRRVDVADTSRAIKALVGEISASQTYVESIMVGKVGLALSGGGFRASLYHLGVLARLAESDLLRHVSTLSTVSGGSMVGAAYYLRVRQLLQTNAAPQAPDYVSVVQDLIEDFRKATDSNLRTGLLTDFKACRAVLMGDDALYAERMAAAIWTNLYSRIPQGTNKSPLAADPQMADLGIVPEGEDADFHPRYHNIFRAAKVPALMLNATTLNTGHSWHFTAQSMGESPFSIVDGADALPRFRRSYYRNSAGNIARTVTLSQAVGASACVPGLFAPLQLDTLYKDHKVRLADGGVFDNQGALALLQDDCSVLIVSDAAGQLGLSSAPGGGHLSPLMRAMDIFQERMRLATFDRLRSARDNRSLSGLAYVHMKQDLQAGAIDWIECEDPYHEGDQLPGGVNRNQRTTYGVWKEHQEHLAAIRTDLDVFSDIEAAALMASGYMAMDRAVERLLGDVPALKPSPSAPKLQRPDWFFNPAIKILGGPHKVLDCHLKAGAKQFLRLADLDSAVKRMLKIGVGVLLAIVVLVFWATWDRSFAVSVRWIGLAILGAVLSWLGKKYLGKYSWAVQLTDPLGALQSQARRWGAVFGTWWLAKRIVPKLTEAYLAKGRLDQLDKP